MKFVVVLVGVLAAANARNVLKRNAGYGAAAGGHSGGHGGGHSGGHGGAHSGGHGGAHGGAQSGGHGGAHSGGHGGSHSSGQAGSHGGSAPSPAAAPTTAAPTTVKTTTQSGVTCAVPKRPEPVPGCYWVPQRDAKFCITGFECGPPPPSADSATKKPCKALNPLTESDVDKAGSDEGCETGNPGWGGDQSCRCKYTVKSRDGDDCPTRFWRTCKKVGADGKFPGGADGENGVPTCPPLVFPTQKDGCMLVKSRDENGCDTIMNMCPDAGTSSSPAGHGGASPAAHGGAPPAPPPPGPVQVAPPQAPSSAHGSSWSHGGSAQPTSTGQQPSGYRN